MRQMGLGFSIGVFGFRGLGFRGSGSSSTDILVHSSQDPRCDETIPFPMSRRASTKLPRTSSEPTLRHLKKQWQLQGARDHDFRVYGVEAQGLEFRMLHLRI